MAFMWRHHNDMEIFSHHCLFVGWITSCFPSQRAGNALLWLLNEYDSSIKLMLWLVVNFCNLGYKTYIAIKYDTVYMDMLINIHKSVADYVVNVKFLPGIIQPSWTKNYSGYGFSQWEDVNVPLLVIFGKRCEFHALYWLDFHVRILAGMTNQGIE